MTGGVCEVFRDRGLVVSGSEIASRHECFRADILAGELVSLSLGASGSALGHTVRELGPNREFIQNCRGSHELGELMFFAVR
jgi:hypothetical protein